MMSKDTLDTLSKTELWERFPIRLVPHDPWWKTVYAQEKALITNEVPEVMIKRIEHIGSTAVEGIHAKPTIDILLEIEEVQAFDAFTDPLERAGYIRTGKGEKRWFFRKGYTMEGYAERVVHLHLRKPGDNDELYFRDYLLEHPEVAKAYEALKRALKDNHEKNRDDYTDGKTDFIMQYTIIAKAQYASRYDE